MAADQRRRIRTVSPGRKRERVPVRDGRRSCRGMHCAELIEPHYPSRSRAPARGSCGAYAAYVLRCSTGSASADEACGRSAAGQRRAPCLAPLGRHRPRARARARQRRFCKLEDNGLGEQLFAAVGQVLPEPEAEAERTGTIVDATIIPGAPARRRTPRRRVIPRCTRLQGSQWYFRHETAHRGGQPHGAMHSAVVTAANVRQAPVARAAARRRKQRV